MKITRTEFLQQGISRYQSPICSLEFLFSPQKKNQTKQKLPNIDCYKEGAGLWRKNRARWQILTVLVICCCITNYPQTYWLKGNKYYLMVSGGQRSGCSLDGALAQGLLGASIMVQQRLLSSQASTGEGSPSQLTHVVAGRPQFLPSYWSTAP